MYRTDFLQFTLQIRDCVVPYKYLRTYTIPRSFSKGQIRVRLHIGFVFRIESLRIEVFWIWEVVWVIVETQYWYEDYLTLLDGYTRLLYEAVFCARPVKNGERWILS